MPSIFNIYIVRACKHQFVQVFKSADMRNVALLVYLSSFDRPLVRSVRAEYLLVCARPLMIVLKIRRLEIQMKRLTTFLVYNYRFSLHG